MKVLTVKIPESTEKKLNSLCQQTSRTKSFLIREALDRYFDEDAVYRKALDRLNDYFVMVGLSGCTCRRIA